MPVCAAATQRPEAVEHAFDQASSAPVAWVGQSLEALGSCREAAAAAPVEHAEAIAQ